MPGAFSLKTEGPATPARNDTTGTGEVTLDAAIRDYVRAYAVWHGRP